ncbi:MAG: enhanced serine sensitivity protein SseB C-terminal domain-containing protein [Eubacterium sp.]|nr:enhanced serine sensitivity protein SseB C-terminal domain-containing protein [Eubacterium sp.]
MTDEQKKILRQKTMELKNPELLAAMRELKKSPTPPPKVQADYINSLLRARLIVPVAMEDAQEENKLNVKFSHITNKQGKKYFMAFTDIETLKQSSNDVDRMAFLGLTYNDFAKMLSDPKCQMEGFAINPFTENIVIGPQQAHAIKSIVNAQRVKNGELAVITELEDIPEEVTRPLENYFDSRGDVKKAYLMGMRKGEQFNRLIIADVDEGTDFQEFTKDLNEKLLSSTNDEKAPYLVMSFAEETVKHATKEKVPFYVKV